jgi:L-fuculose-phosphate aldolase
MADLKQPQPPIPVTHPRDELLALMQRIYGHRMTTTSGGNISLKDESGDVWITPSRVDKGALTRADMVRVRPDGGAEGTRRPSSETPFHLEVYRRRPDVRGVVHAHAVALVAFSLAHQTPDTRIFHQAWSVCGRAGFAPYELPGSEALGRSIAGIFEAGFNSVILENHGVVTAGESLPTAFHRFETLEFVARTIIKGRLLGNVQSLSDEELALPDRRDSDYPPLFRSHASSEERELRRRLCEFVRRGYRHRLFISTEGTYSARLSEHAFLITPNGVDRAQMRPEDLVLVDRGRVEEGRTPSRAFRSHELVYRRHPGIGSLINALPVNATAFAITGEKLETRTIPESYLVVREPVYLTHREYFESDDAIAKRISPSRPVAIVQNDGVLAAGADPLEAFDRLEVLESTAEAIINCRAIGPMTRMGDAVIRELEAAFLK